MKKYSVVLHPSDVIIEEVKQMKELLASKLVGTTVKTHWLILLSMNLNEMRESWKP